MSKSTFALSSALCAFLLACPPAFAEPDMQSELERLEKRLNDQEKLIEDQQRILIDQSEEIYRQKKMIDSLSSARARTGYAPELKPQVMAMQTGRGSAPAAQRVNNPRPVVIEERVEAPNESRPNVEAIANQGGILSPAGALTFETATEYTNTTRNVFAFNGVQLAEVVLVGDITAQNARRQIVQQSGRLRLGLTDRMEIDVHVPFVYRNDALTNTINAASTTTTTVEGANIGDIDMGLAYQINDGKAGWPFLIGNVRYKANNAEGPLDVPYDSNNIAKRLPTGTGFNTIEGSVTAIKVNDPVVLYGNLGYVYDMPRDINRDFSGVYITRVSPGDAINALVGMAFAINQDTSFSLGYKHSYVFPTIEERTNGDDINSGTSQVGSLNFGLTYALSPATSLNFNIETGVTNDAPDVHLIFRVPFRLGNLF
ncbi:MAG: hypothetical protein PHE27_00785 [Alphaproteobacteria bacterium]|nr:hypothetical protein [Alphaproteobacteria bacterium]